MMRILLVASDDVRSVVEDADRTHSTVNYHLVQNSDPHVSQGAVHPSGGHPDLLRDRRKVEVAFRADLNLPQDSFV